MSDYSYEDHLAMIIDEARMDAYTAAIPDVVRPGDVVVDLGAGAGVMTFLALEAGASHVHAIEWSDSVDILRRVAKHKGVAEKITIHRTDSRRARLPRSADVLIADVRGALPILGEGLSVVIDARKRLLAPGGRQIPTADELYLAPVEHPDAHEHVSGWARTPVEGYECMVPVCASRYVRSPFGEAALLSPGAAAGVVRYDVAAPQDVSGAVEFEIGRDGVFHGLGGWFESELAPGVRLSSAPEHTETVYGQAFFPLQNALTLAAGDRVRVELAIRTGPVEPVVLWTVRVDTGAHAGFEERRCSIDGTLMSVDALRKRAGEFVPTLGETGRAQLFVLERMARGMSIGAIAEQLREAFPERYSSLDEASAAVGKLSVSLSD